MMTGGELANDVGVLLGGLLTLCVLAGLAVRFVLVPYLREHLVKPVQETHRQVTENRHQNVEPTVLDRIDDVHEAVRRLETTTVAVQAVANAAARAASQSHRRMDRHEHWADLEATRIWRAVDQNTRNRKDAEQ